MYGSAVSGRSTPARLVLVALVGLVVLLGLLQGAAWGQPGQKAVAGQVPAPVGQGNAQLRGGVAPSAQLSLNVDLSVRESAQLAGVIAAASTPGSPSYGHYLTESEYMARYAPTDAQLAAVESWLASQGLSVTGASKDNLLVHVDGSTAAVESAFSIAVNNYAASGKEFYANDREPSVPADLAVTAISGLSDYYKPVADITCFSTICGYTGNDYRAAYNVAGNAEGQTIAYTLWGKPPPSTTYKEYAEVTKTPELKFGKGNEQIEFKELGGASSVNNNDEIALDTESAHLVAPGAHHLYFLAKEGNLSQLETAADEAALSEAKVISNSWEAEGACPLADPGMEAILEKGAALGKTFFFATDDFGAAHGCSYPSSSQYAVAVGGTALEVGAGSAWKKEIAIENGGNCNNAITRPSWQTGLGEPHVFPKEPCSGRVTPDVSADSCGSKEETVTFGDCFLLVVEGGVGTNGGTSLSTPVWAAAAAVWNKGNAAAGRPGIGFVDPLLYALGNDPVTYARDFHDITEGSNGFPAGKGWDEATGLGSPNINNLANNEAELAYTGPAGAVDEQTVTLSAKLTDHASSQPLSGHTVHFGVGAESCEAATNSAGVASCGVQIKDAPGGYTLTAHAASTAAYLEASTSAGFTVSAPPAPPFFGRCLKAPGEKVGAKRSSTVSSRPRPAPYRAPPTPANSNGRSGRVRKPASLWRSNPKPPSSWNRRAATP